MEALHLAESNVVRQCPELSAKNIEMVCAEYLEGLKQARRRCCFSCPCVPKLMHATFYHTFGSDHESWLRCIFQLVGKAFSAHVQEHMGLSCNTQISVAEPVHGRLPVVGLPGPAAGPVVMFYSPLQAS